MREIGCDERTGGYRLFCIDNVPAELLPSITAFSKAGDNQLKRVALSMDVRGCHTSEQIEQALHQAG